MAIGISASRVLFDESRRQVNVNDRGWQVVLTGMADEFLSNWISTAAR